MLFVSLIEQSPRKSFSSNDGPRSFESPESSSEYLNARAGCAPADRLHLGPGVGQGNDSYIKTTFKSTVRNLLLLAMSL